MKIDNDRDEGYWQDHRYFLLPGEPVNTLRKVNVNMQTIKPYIETHGTQRGPVFFPDLDTARRYMKVTDLTGYNVVMFPVPNDDYFQAICQELGCNVVYCIYSVGMTFRRDVTEFTLPPAEDGQHRWKGKEQ
jgi:hypothetical protein